MVLISKADLLGPLDRQRMMDYVRQHLLSEANLDLPVHLVSVIGADAQFCEEWFESELKPMLESHREAASASLKRKIGLLREAVMDALRVRLDAACSPTGRARHSVRAGEDLRDGGAQRTDAPYQEIDSCLTQAAAYHHTCIWSYDGARHPGLPGMFLRCNPVRSALPAPAIYSNQISYAVILLR